MTNNNFDPIVLLTKYIATKLKVLGVQLVYSSLLLYNAYKSGNAPTWCKNIIIGALGYLLSPIDSLPDMTPFFGYTDDMGVLSFALVTIACYIDEDVRTNAKLQLSTYFKNIDEDILLEIDNRL